MEKIALEQLKAALRETHVYRWSLRDCSVCNVKLFYMLDRKGIFVDV
jgi:hypothetical protein